VNLIETAVREASRMARDGRAGWAAWTWSRRAVTAAVTVAVTVTAAAAVTVAGEDAVTI